jgi:hypothetical protein
MLFMPTVRSDRIPFVPNHLGDIPVHQLDALRLSLGHWKLMVRRQTRNEKIDWTKPLTSARVIAELKPCNAGIDRINREEVRRDEAAVRRRQAAKIEYKPER